VDHLYTILTINKGFRDIFLGCSANDNEGRPLPLLWDWLIRRSTFPSVFGLEKLAEKQPPRKGKWAAEVAVFLHTYFNLYEKELY